MLTKLWRDKRVGILQRETEALRRDIENIRNHASDRAREIDEAIAAVRVLAERLADQVRSGSERADRAEHQLADTFKQVGDVGERVDSLKGSLLRVEREAELSAEQTSRMATGLLERMVVLQRSVSGDEIPTG